MRKYFLNFIYLLFAILTTYFFYDIIVDFISETLHLILEILHIIFELLESGLDFIVEKILHTDIRETQIIVFYIMLVILSVISYYLYTIGNLEKPPNLR